MQLYSNNREGNRSLNPMFEFDPVSRFQYEEVHDGASGLAERYAAERALMRAVLKDGIACFQGYLFKPSRSNKKLFEEAEEWIDSIDDDLFSFNSICETLRLSPSALRKRLKQWKAQTRESSKERKRIHIRKGRHSRKNESRPTVNR